MGLTGVGTEVVGSSARGWDQEGEMGRGGTREPRAVRMPEGSWGESRRGVRPIALSQVCTESALRCNETMGQALVGWI